MYAAYNRVLGFISCSAKNIKEMVRDEYQFESPFFFSLLSVPAYSRYRTNGLRC